MTAPFVIGLFYPTPATTFQRTMLVGHNPCPDLGQLHQIFPKWHAGNRHDKSDPLIHSSGKVYPAYSVAYCL